VAHGRSSRTPNSSGRGREIEKLNEELEQRVVERTRELAATNEELRREIARREQVEELLRTRERHFRTIIENSADGIALFSPDGSIHYASPSTPRVLGYTPEELVSFNAFDLIHPEDQEAVRQGINAILGRPAVSADVQVHVRHKDGEWRWLEGAFTNMIDEPHVGSIVNNFRDITERRRADDLLRQSEYQLAEAQRLARLGSWTWNLDDNVLTWSDELYRIYGLDPRKFTPTYDAFMRLVHPEDVDFVAQEVERSAKNLEPLNYRLRIVRPDGEVRIIHSRGRVAADERGVPFRLYGAAQDVTEQKRAEEQLRQTTEQLRALSARLRSAREEEAVRIAREIHDELGAALSSLRWDLEEVGEVVSEAADASRLAALRRKIADMMGLTDAAVNTVRRITSELRPTALDQLGLVEAIEWQAQQFQERTGIVVNCDCALESDDLTQEQSTAIFRIFQEALTNVLRHAQATRVDITAKKEADEFVLTSVTTEEESQRRSKQVCRRLVCSECANVLTS
jgi:PAS domain S-box-containing protein